MAKTQIVHNGTVTNPVGGFKAGDAVGPIYIGDIGRRLDHPSELELTSGQDQYINPGDTLLVEETGDVLLSADSGMLAMMSALGVLSLTFGITS